MKRTALQGAKAASVLTTRIISVGRDMSGRRAPTTAEQAAILSAMLLVALELGKTSRSEVMAVYQIAARHELEPPILDLALARFVELQETGTTPAELPPQDNALGRRRILAAAMLMARKPNAATPGVEALIERLILQIGATMEDAVAVRAALDAWDADCRDIGNVPLFSLLRDRPLALNAA